MDDLFTLAYIGCALWAESGDPQSPLGVSASVYDLDSETRTMGRLGTGDGR